MYDVFSKIQEHRSYDMQKILIDIKKKYPFSTLNFQNIKIEGNYAKRGVSHNGAPEDYYESTYVSIKNGKLRKENNFTWLLCFFPLILILFVSQIPKDPRTLKIKDLHTIGLKTFIYILSSIFISVIIFSPLFKDKYVSPYKDINEFSREISILLDEINLEKYKIYD